MSDKGDWYCKNCGYICGSRVTSSETCDTCHQPVEWHTVTDQGEIQRLEAELEEAKSYCKDGESVSDCIKRNRADVSKALGQLSNALNENAELRREVTDLKMLRDSESEIHHEQVRETLNAIREVYALAGEDPQINKICNRILERSEFQGI